MALLNEEEQLASAWRALSGEAGSAGWKVIDLFSANGCKVMAGRKGTGNEESLLVGISGATVPAESQLPRGQGFIFIHTELPGDASKRTWFALVRQQSGQLPLFSLMAADLVSLLARLGGDGGEGILSALMTRIHAWQSFMKHNRPDLLSSEEEIGLVGELFVLGNLISDGMPPADAIQSWVGPTDGLHDFTIGPGGIEVKSTTAPKGFVAKIGSLDQLDNSLYQPLYVGSVRLWQSNNGSTLPDLVDLLKEKIHDEAAIALLSSRLVAAGYIDSMRNHYVRRFVNRELAYRLVKDDSPRLTRANVPSAIYDAKYMMDLDVIPVVATTFSEISSNLGVNKAWS